MFVSLIVTPQTGFLTLLRLDSHTGHEGIIEICLSDIVKTKVMYPEVPGTVPNSKQPLNTESTAYLWWKGNYFAACFFFLIREIIFPHGCSRYPRGPHRHENSGLGSCYVLKCRYSSYDVETRPGSEG